MDDIRSNLRNRPDAALVPSNDTTLIRWLHFRQVSVIAIVESDISGLSTYSAIHAGAKLALGSGPFDKSDDLIDEARRLLYDCCRAAAETRSRSTELSQQDRRIITMISAGMTTKQIAQQLFESERTMYRRLNEVYQKCGVKNRRQIVAMAGTVRSVPQQQVAH